MIECTIRPRVRSVNHSIPSSAMTTRRPEAFAHEAHVALEQHLVHEIPGAGAAARLLVAHKRQHQLAFRLYARGVCQNASTTSTAAATPLFSTSAAPRPE